MANLWHVPRCTLIKCEKRVQQQIITYLVNSKYSRQPDLARNRPIFSYPREKNVDIKIELSQRSVQNLPPLLTRRRPWRKYSLSTSEHSSPHDEEICHMISPFHGHLWLWSEQEASGLGYTQVQGTLSFTTKYIRRVGEAGCCLDDLLKFSYLKKQDLLWHAMVLAIYTSLLRELLMIGWSDKRKKI